MSQRGDFRGTTKLTRRLAFAVVLAVFSSQLFVTGAVAAPGPSLHPAPAANPGRAVRGVHNLPTRFVKPRDQARDPYRATRTTWPAASRASIPPSSAAPAVKRRAAGTPVWVQPSTSGARSTGAFEVKVYDQATAQRAGVKGVLFSVAGSSLEDLHVGLDYGTFAEAYGGNFGSRLGLVQLPACVLTAPETPSCQRLTPLTSINDPGAQAVSAPVAGQQGSTVVVAAVGTAAEGGGEAGTYTATELKPSGSWSAGSSTGSFTYTYPVQVPPAPSSLVPDLALTYDSGSIDGQTASTQAQSSWIGDGWSSPQSYVEQTFASCADEPGGSAAPVATTDQCYDGEILTLSIKGSTAALVWDATKKVYKPKDDNGSVITRVTGSNNGSGTYNTDYWRVTQRDGTVFEFGRNQLTGWSSGKPTTNSVDYVPVYSPHAGDPCYSSNGWSASVCTMAYRWNLDYVKDVHGNAMAYYYKQDTNKYGQNNGALNGTYVRDSYLDHIDYGFTDGGAYSTSAAKITFTTGPRCIATSCTPLSATTKANWPDVPYDLICTTSTVCPTRSASFFSTVRLTGITAAQYSPSAATYVTVDSYALTQTLPATGDGTSPTLWLSSITRTGADTTAGGSSAPITLPATTFTGVKLQNRVDNVTDGLPAFNRFRIESITNETGSVATVAYSRPNPCTAPVTLDPATNTSSCYPVYWTPEGATTPFKDWFNKYAATKVTATDPTGGAPTTATSYVYQGGAAWHFDDNEVVKAKYRTYGQFRGYAKVRTLQGDGVNDPQTLSETTYYRGMSRNNNTAAVLVTDSQGGTHDDHNALAGEALETTSYVGNGGPVDRSTITSYWVSDATATRARTGLQALTANAIAPVESFTRQAVTGTGTTTWRYIETDNSYDDSITSPTFGLLKHTYTHTVPVDAAFSSCTTVSYAAANTAKNLVGLTSQTETVSVACGGFTQGSPASVPGILNKLTTPSTVNRPDQVISSTRTFYDDPNFDTSFPQTDAPTRGLVTLSQEAVGYSGGTYAYVTTSRAEYDSAGRVTGAYDANGNKTETTYTTNSVGLVTGVTTTNPLNQTMSVALDPLRGLTLTSTDLNEIVTTQRYDALGRVTAVWLNSRATTLSADYTFAYTVSNTGPTSSTTKTLNDFAGYYTTVRIYDAQGRPRQSQEMTPQGGRMVTDTFYDTRGWVSRRYNGWWDDTTTPTTTPVSAADLHKSVPNQDFYTYDGLGRTVISEKAKDGVVVSKTTTVYNGDRATVVPPTGAVTATTVTDPLGRTTELRQYTAAPTVNTPSNTFTGTFSVSGGTTAVTRYGYDGHGNNSTITDPQNNTWTTAYDLLGRATSRTDPDAGTTGMSYDNNGNLVQTTDSRSKAISYTYDALNRRTGQHTGPANAQSTNNRLAAWVYDNSNNAVAGMKYPLGKLTTATAFYGGNAYVRQQNNFNVFGASTGETITIPAVEGNLAGKYTYVRSYTTTKGLLLREGLPAGGTLPAETLTYGYTSVFDLPDRVGGNISGYAQGTTYDAYGRVNQETIGAAPNLGYITNTYDPHTGWLTEQLITRAVGTPRDVDKQAYTYDLAGNILRQTSTRLGSATATETQCNKYDALRRLTAVWTATDDCAATPTGSDSTMVGDSLGPTSAYWTEWDIDVLGNRTKRTKHDLTGGADTVTTYTYDGAGDHQPHTLTSTSTTGATPGTTTYSYDEAGNTLTRKTPEQGDQNLNWDDAGRLTSVAGSTNGDSSYIYDADGNLLLQKDDPGTTTLYLPSQQLTLNTANQTVTGVRYYTLPGGGSAIRNGSGTNYLFMIADQHGTPALYLDSTAQTPTWRQFTPYGQDRGPNISTIDNRGFLNQPTNTTTGLTHLGARDYDPTTGRFITVDPILDITDPQQMNGYAYASNNPITFSDPDGLMARAEDGGGCGGTCPPPPWVGNETPKKKKSTGRRVWDGIVGGGKDFGKGLFGSVTSPITEGMRDFRSVNERYQSGEISTSDWFWENVRLVGWHGCKMTACAPFLLVKGIYDLGASAISGYGSGDVEGGTRSTTNLLLTVASIAIPGVKLPFKGAKPPAAAPVKPGPVEIATKTARACVTHSFDPSTPVLMADGSTKPIKDIREGDLVLAAIEETDVNLPGKVVALHHNQDRDLTDLTITTDDGKQTTLHTTNRHPFWSLSAQGWMLAGDLRVGDRLRTAGSSVATVTGVVRYGGDKNMQDLTIADYHTYYVLAGDTPVLVHNTGGPSGPAAGAAGTQMLINDLQARGYMIRGTEISMTAANGVNVRFDVVAEKNGVLSVYDAKNGPSAGFTKNQGARGGYAAVETHGGTFYGPNAQKAGLAGTSLGPTRVNIAGFGGYPHC